MAHQNRVTPEGEIVAVQLTGLFMGNRGCLHEDRTIVRPWKTLNWVTCALEFKDRRVAQWQAGRYTPLFFSDEAVALAAGHRPCAECRRADYRRWCAAWEAAFGERASAPAMDRRLHVDRVDGRQQRRHTAAWDDLPDGAFVHTDGRPALVWGDQTYGWTDGVYQEPQHRPRTGTVTVLTPAATTAVLGHRYRPVVAIAAS